MTKKIYLVTICFLMLGLFPGWSLADKDNHIGLEAGYFLPSNEDFSDIYGSGPVFGLNAGLKITNSFELSLGANYFSKNALTAITGQDLDISIITTRLGVYYLFSMRTIIPRLGAGLVLCSVDENTPFGNYSKSKIGWYAAVGTDILLGDKFSIGGEIQYSDISIDGDFGSESTGGVTILVIFKFFL
jgi:hypothetical protein